MWRKLHGFSLLRRPLPLLVTSLVFSGVFCSSSGASDLCDVCTVWPSCDDARRVTCDLTNSETITFRKGDIPETVEAVIIRNSRHVVVEEDDISGLHLLTNLTFEGIDKLEIKQGGMALQNLSRLRLVTFQNIESLQIKSKAFSGVWQPKTSIRMHRIGRLSFESNAFDYQVTEEGPSVSLQHVEMLNLERHGFAASIFQLEVYNVTMGKCHSGRFGGNTSHTFLNDLTITEAEPKCFHATNDFATLNMKDLKMQTVHSQAFSGNIRELTIKDSHFTTIHERGFDIRVTKMQVSDTKIHDLRYKGIFVVASVEIRLENIQIDDLRKNALASLRMKHSSDGDKQRLHFNQFAIVRAENGYLALAESLNLQNFQMKNMHVMSRKIPICPTEKWARMLTGASPNGPLNLAQTAELSSLINISSCEDDSSAVNKVLYSRSLEESWSETTADTLSAVEGPAPEASGVQPHESEVKAASQESEVEVASHESEVEATSHESEESFPTEYREEVGSGGPHEAGISCEEMHRTQVLTLAVVLSLAVVLIVALLLLMVLLRCRRSRKPANDQPSTLETLAEVLACRLTGRDEDHEKSGGSRLQTGRTGGSFYSSASPSLDYHRYETIKNEPLLPFPQPTKGGLLLPPLLPTRGDILVPLSAIPQP